MSDRKYCKHCDCTHPNTSEFWAGKKRRVCKAQRSKWRSATPEESREYRLRRIYGLSTEEYNAMYVKQEGKCAICACSRPRLHVDHDHITGKVRGLLCNSCNTLLGVSYDSISILKCAVEYIKAAAYA